MYKARRGKGPPSSFTCLRAELIQSFMQEKLPISCFSAVPVNEGRHFVIHYENHLLCRWFQLAWQGFTHEETDFYTIQSTINGGAPQLTTVDFNRVKAKAGMLIEVSILDIETGKEFVSIQVLGDITSNVIEHTEITEGQEYTFYVNDENIDVVIEIIEAAPAGNQTSHTVDGVAFNMRLARAATNFPTVTDDSGSATVVSPYWIAETQVTICCGMQ